MLTRARTTLIREQAKTLQRRWFTGQHRVLRSTLSNGLRLIVIPQPHLHTATLAAFVKVGSRFETPRSNGLSHFLEHMLFRGTSRHPSAYALNLVIEELGGTLYGATHADFTLYEVSLPPETLCQAIQHFGEILTTPVFQDIEVEKDIVREEILEGLDEDGGDIDIENVSRHLVFGDHPLGYKITGCTTNVDAFSMADLRRHLDDFYVARNMVLCVAGAVDPRVVEAQVRRHLATLRPGRPVRVEPPQRLALGPRFLHVESPGSQTDLRISFPTFGEADVRQLALQLLARVLDDGMSTRLHRRICDEKGLAYEVFAALDPYEDCGVFDLGATVEHAKAPALISELLRLLDELRSAPVTERELAKAQRRYCWDIRATLDDADAMCMHYGTQALLGREAHLDGLMTRIAAIEPADLQQVARVLFRPDALHVTAVGMLDDELQATCRGLVQAWA